MIRSDDSSTTSSIFDAIPRVNNSRGHFSHLLAIHTYLSKRECGDVPTFGVEPYIDRCVQGRLPEVRDARDCHEATERIVDLRFLA